MQPTFLSSCRKKPHISCCKIKILSAAKDTLTDMVLSLLSQQLHFSEYPGDLILGTWSRNVSLAVAIARNSLSNVPDGTSAHTIVN